MTDYLPTDPANGYQSDFEYRHQSHYLHLRSPILCFFSHHELASTRYLGPWLSIQGYRGVDYL